MNRFTKWCLAIGVAGVIAAMAVALGESKLAPINEPVALTCSLSDPAKVARRTELRAKFWPAVVRTEELETGYTFEFAGKDAGLVLDFVSFERDCCTFFSFVIEIEPKNGPVRLTMSGPEGTKEFLNAAFADELKSGIEKTLSKPAAQKSIVDKCCQVLGI